MPRSWRSTIRCCASKAPRPERAASRRRRVRTCRERTDVVVDELRTYHGTVGYTLRRSAPDALAPSLRGPLVPPPGGIVLRPPLAGRLVEVQLDGVPVDDFLPDEVTVRACPVNVVLRYRSER
jgi:hypothetical protein